MDNVQPLGTNVKKALDVALGFRRDSNDRICHFERSLLQPDGEIIATTELLAFPGPERLE